MVVATEQPTHIEFFFDPICPYAYQTSLWIRDVREQLGFSINWRFFSLEEMNRTGDSKHPWEREIAYGWSQMRVSAWLRRQNMDWCDRHYDVCGKALHIEGRRPYDRTVAMQLLSEADLPTNAWGDALADPTTHDDVRRDHDDAVNIHAGFGVPIIIIPGARAVFGPVVVPVPPADRALELWDMTVAYSKFPGLFEIKTPKTNNDLQVIGNIFKPYLEARQWPTIMNPAP